MEDLDSGLAPRPGQRAAHQTGAPPPPPLSATHAPAPASGLARPEHFLRLVYLDNSLVAVILLVADLAVAGSPVALGPAAVGWTLPLWLLSLHEAARREPFQVVGAQHPLFTCVLDELVDDPRVTPGLELSPPQPCSGVTETAGEPQALLPPYAANRQLSQPPLSDGAGRGLCGRPGGRNFEERSGELVQSARATIARGRPTVCASCSGPRFCSHSWRRWRSSASSASMRRTPRTYPTIRSSI